MRTLRGEFYYDQIPLIVSYDGVFPPKTIEKLQKSFLNYLRINSVCLFW